MNTENQTQTKTDFSIHPATKMGHVSLTVANLENQILFYTKVLGFQLHWREGNQAGLGAGGADLLRLTEEPNLKRYRGTTGLYHFAILFPNRKELARAFKRLFDQGVPIEGASDHGVSEAIYLRDPDGNGVELYWDRPKEHWPRSAEGGLAMFSHPLELDALLKQGS